MDYFICTPLLQSHNEEGYWWELFEKIEKLEVGLTASMTGGREVENMSLDILK